jgi:hypothetical protein
MKGLVHQRVPLSLIHFPIHEIHKHRKLGEECKLPNYFLVQEEQRLGWLHQIEEKIQTLHLNEEPFRGLNIQNGLFHKNVLLRHIHKETHALLRVSGDIPHDPPF